jgi:hypothetical protein
MNTTLPPEGAPPVINGHEQDFMMKTSAANFALINRVPVF